jgi:hypothetical protein
MMVVIGKWCSFDLTQDLHTEHRDFLGKIIYTLDLI